MDWLGTDPLCGGLEAPLPSPAGGSAAAVSGAMAASLVVMVGQGSPDWPAGLDAAAAAASMRQRLLALGSEDVDAVGAVLTAARAGAGTTDAGLGLVPALLWASRVPVEIAECAAEVLVLAGDATREGKRPMRADAEAAVLLARTATQVAVTIVAANLAAPVLAEVDAQPLRAAARLAAERAGIGPEVEAVLGVTASQ